MAKGRGGFLGQDGLNAPDQATDVEASAGNAEATVSFTSPSDVGGSAITGYRVTDSTGAFGESGSASPITVTGLTNGTSYTFNVWAINAFGWSAPSDASDAVSPAAPLGVFARGYTGSYTNTIDYVTMSSAGNATDWGDATSANGNGSGTANATRGLFASSQAIDYITFSSTGNAADFGDMPSTDNSARCPTSGSNSTRGLLTRENATTYNGPQCYGLCSDFLE